MRVRRADLAVRYDLFAANYADEFFSELEQKLFDRELIDERKPCQPFSQPPG